MLPHSPTWVGPERGADGSPRIEYSLTEPSTEHQVQLPLTQLDPTTLSGPPFVVALVAHLTLPINHISFMARIQMGDAVSPITAFTLSVHQQ